MTAIAERKQFLKSRLTAGILGERLTVDFYARNGFRFLGLPASVDMATLSTRSQKFRNLFKLSMSKAAGWVIETIPDAHLDPAVPLRAVERLGNPRRRIVDELFWPHLPQPIFQEVTSAGRISESIVGALDKGGTNRVPASLILHTIALGRHCDAINEEIAHRAGANNPPRESWQKALESWAEVCSSDEFWRYLAERVKQFDDPRIQAAGIPSVRAELPGIILGLNGSFANFYALNGQDADCIRHLDLIRGAGFCSEVVQENLETAVRRVANAKLRELIRSAKEQFTSFSERVPRKRFQMSCQPLLDEADRIKSVLQDDLGLEEALLAESAFDDFAEVVHGASQAKIQFDGDDRERSILFSALISRRLMTLPLSDSSRRKLVQSIRNDSKLLFGTDGLRTGEYPDLTRCYFLDGETADPDASLTIPMYRVTGRKLQVNTYAGTYGVRVSYASRRMLIPRSTKAAKFHSGRKIVEPILVEDYTPQQRATADQVEELEQGRATELARLKEQERQALADEKAHCDQELTEYARRIGNEQAAARKAIVAGEELKGRELGKRGSRFAADRERVQKSLKKALKRATEKSLKVEENLAGFSHGWLIEFPLVTLAALGGVAIIYFSTDYNGFGPAIGGLMASLILARLLRFGLKVILSISTRRQRWVLSRELGKLKRAHRKKLREIEKTCAQQLKNPQAILSEIERRRESIVEEGKAREAKILAGCEQEQKRAVAKIDKKIRRLQEELTRQIKAKPQSKKNDFPSILAAKKKEFKQGTEPTAQEMEMTPSERTRALMQLGGL